MKKLGSILMAAVAMLVASSTVQADIIADFTGGGTFVGGVYGDFAQAGTAAGVNLTSASSDSADGAFESLGQPVFSNDAEIILTLGVNAGNTATDINVLLLDQDNGGADGEAYLYNVDLTGLGPGQTAVNLGTLADFTSMNPDTFGHGAGDGIQNFDAAPDGLYEWQIQGSFANPGGVLDIVVSTLEINPATGAIPEPTSLALLGLGALGLVARRRRS